MHSGGVGDVLSYPDYMPMGGVPSLESPANQFSSMSAPPLDIYSNLQVGQVLVDSLVTYHHHVKPPW